MNWTNFRLSAPLDQPLLPSSSPRKRRLHSLQNIKRLFRTLHLICMWQNHAIGAIWQINHRPPEWATVPEWYLPGLHLTFRFRFRKRKVRGQNKLWDFTTFARSDFIEVRCFSGSYLGLKEYKEKLAGHWTVFFWQTWSECHKVNRRKYA